MATKSQTESGRTAELVIDPTERLDPECIDDETPTHVLVQVSSNGRSQMAIVAAGTAGRWSFDFRIDSSGIEVERAFEEGIRVNVDELPVWMSPVQERVEDLVMAGQ